METGAGCIVTMPRYRDWCSSGWTRPPARTARVGTPRAGSASQPSRTPSASRTPATMARGTLDPNHCSTRTPRTAPASSSGIDGSWDPCLTTTNTKGTRATTATTAYRTHGSTVFLRSANSNAIVRMPATRAVSANDLPSPPIHVTRGSTQNTLLATMPIEPGRNCRSSTTTTAAVAPTANALTRRNDKGV